MDPVSLATTAVTAVGSYLLGLAGKAGEEGAKETGKAALSWIRGKLSGETQKKAVADFEAEPQDELNRMTLQVAVAKALKADPNAAEALKALLAQAGAGAVNQTNTIIGPNGIGINASGSTVNVRR